MSKLDLDPLVAEFLARGGTVTKCPPAPRPDPRRLARTGAETFFARQHRWPLSERERAEIAQGFLGK